MDGWLNRLINGKPRVETVPALIPKHHPIIFSCFSATLHSLQSSPAVKATLPLHVFVCVGGGHYGLILY